MFEMEYIETVSIAIGLIGVTIIAWGSLLMLIRLVRLEVSRFRKASIFRERETVRHQLGSYLLLGLEFLIAADIIRTVSHPTIRDMAILGIIVAIRTVISYFLDREIEEFRPPEKPVV